MRVAIFAANGINGYYWLDSQLTDFFYDLDPISEICMAGENVTEKKIIKILGPKYPITQLPHSMQEYGLAAIHRRNLEIIKSSKHILALSNGNSRNINNVLELASRLKVDVDLRFYREQ